ncbi:MAG TPA: hypothetical protein DEO39_00050, partial [Clostridiales bacterium]|nr:hypothetical protein [Clostridiales bacterium]
MKHNASAGYGNIYGTRSPRRRSRNDRRKVFVVTCLFICMVCVILDVIFIAKLLKKGKKEATPTTAPSSAVSLETDECGNVITSSESQMGESTEPSETTSAKTQTVDAATRSANLTALQTKI